jgi:hypothetical protein
MHRVHLAPATGALTRATGAVATRLLASLSTEPMIAHKASPTPAVARGDARTVLPYPALLRRPLSRAAQGNRLPARGSILRSGSATSKVSVSRDRSYLNGVETHHNAAQVVENRDGVAPSMSS